jgi:hypothetical protein
MRRQFARSVPDLELRRTRLPDSAATGCPSRPNCNPASDLSLIRLPLANRDRNWTDDEPSCSTQALRTKSWWVIARRPSPVNQPPGASSQLLGQLVRVVPAGLPHGWPRAAHAATRSSCYDGGRGGYSCSERWGGEP